MKNNNLPIVLLVVFFISGILLSFGVTATLTYLFCLLFNINFSIRLVLISYVIFCLFKVLI